MAPSRGAGSTYKVFVAAAALARGFSTTYTQTTSDPYFSRVYKEDGGPYRVENAGRYRATLDLTTALYQSSNTYFVGLEDALGSVEEPVRMAEAMGLYQFGPDGPGADRSSTRTAAPSPSARTRPARSAWPARTPPSPPAARSATSPP